MRNVPYAWGHHVGLIRQLGFSDEQADMLKKGQVPQGLDAADQAVCAFIFAYSACQGVPDSVLADLRKHFSANQIIEMCQLSGYYMGAGALIIAFELELEPPEILQIELDWQSKRLASESRANA